MDSILNTIKIMLGIPVEQKHFDTDIKMHINSTFLTLRQLGLGLTDVPLIINDDTETWYALFSDDDLELVSAIITYVYMKVKIIFDPPTSAYVLTAYKESIREFECRINYDAEEEVL